MFDIPIRVAHLPILLVAAGWILFLFYWKQEFLKQRPLVASLIEGVMLGVVWAVFLRWTMNDPLEGLLWSGLLTASLWTGFVYYCRFRYSQSLPAKA